MRTTLDIDEDVLRAAKEIARREHRTAGAVISELTRKALTAAPANARERKATHGFRPFPARGGLVTNDKIDRLREDDAY
ncbi:antitoxin [Candidatus Binatia bacterium]|jgi:hypothetical protein|nr:antitoxin [Candidatus Binatia bacterium]